MPQEFNIVEDYHQLQTQLFAGGLSLWSFWLQILQTSSNNGPYKHNIQRYTDKHN
jgi:hypothetical protein